MAEGDSSIVGGYQVLDFGGHSTRSPSTSKAELSGLPVKEVSDRGSWSNESTWQKFYHEEIIKAGQDYQKNVFRGSPRLIFSCSELCSDRDRVASAG